MLTLAQVYGTSGLERTFFRVTAEEK